MKKLLTILLVSSSLLLALSSCKKEEKRIADYSGVASGQALLKINYVSSYSANPGVQLEINQTRVSSVISSRTPFPGGGYNTNGGNYPDYLSVPSGAPTLSIVIPKKSTNTDSIVLFTKPLNLEAGKYYTAHITDTGANTKMILLADDRTQPDTGTSRYRFVNLVPNVAAIDLYYGTTLVASNVPYLGNSPYFVLHVTNTVAQVWTIREAGTGPTGTALATYTSSNTILNQRVYTAFAMGYSGLTDSRKPYISFILNK